MRILLFVLSFLWSLSVCSQDETIYELYANNNVVNQSATNYGKYLFSVKDRLASVILYDLEKRDIIYTLNLKPHDEKLGGKTLIYHCNQCCFGIERYDSNDMFPLLYISQRNPARSTGALVTVFRIIPTLSVNDEVESFTIEEVQRIYLPPMTDLNSMGNPNLVIDTKKGYFYTYSRNNNTQAANYAKTVISKFKLPALIKDGEMQNEVHLGDDDIIDSFSCDFSLINAQGGFFRKGRIYIAQGYPGVNYVYFREINIKKRKQTRVVDMLGQGFNKEPEGVWYYDGHVMITTNGKSIYKLNGKDFKIK